MRQFLFFAYDKQNESVVIGPALLNGVQSGSVPTPSVLEFGGVVQLLTPRRDGSRDAMIAARPYMRPALEAEAPRFPELFRNSLLLK